MSIAKNGIKTTLPDNVKLLSGPGCPVCVTPSNVIDSVLNLAMKDNVIITTYGDMIRVPGSTRGDNLQRRRALGAKVEIVYSPIDAIDIAKKNPDKEIVFLGVGFETTAPGTAAAIKTAVSENVKNFSVFSMLKICEPAIKELKKMQDFSVDGFILPGHVAVIIGEKGFDYLGMPGVIAGFEAEDILLAIKMLISQINDGKAIIENEYKRAVSYEGNQLAQKAIYDCFELEDATWRGLGIIKNSGLKIKDDYSSCDAQKKFDITIEKEKPTACRCGDVITGRIGPEQCPMFGKSCVPEDPIGPCMVSSEGACAACYKYQWTK